MPPRRSGGPAFGQTSISDGGVKVASTKQPLRPARNDSVCFFFEINTRFARKRVQALAAKNTLAASDRALPTSSGVEVLARESINDVGLVSQHPPENSPDHPQ